MLNTIERQLLLDTSLGTLAVLGCWCGLLTWSTPTQSRWFFGVVIIAIHALLLVRWWRGRKHQMHPKEVLYWLTAQHGRMLIDPDRGELHCHFLVNTWHHTVGNTLEAVAYNIERTHANAVARQ